MALDLKYDAEEMYYRLQAAKAELTMAHRLGRNYRNQHVNSIHHQMLYVMSAMELKTALDNVNEALKKLDIMLDSITEQGE